MKHSFFPYWSSNMMLFEQDGGGSGSGSGTADPPPADPPPADPPPADPPPADPPPGEWQQHLPEDIREWEEVKNADSPQKFWDQMKNMKSFLGQSIRVPSKEAGQDDWKKFYDKLTAKVPGLIPAPNTDDEEAVNGIYKALGRPDDPKEYKVPDFGEAENLDLTPVEVFRPIAHKYGLTQKQFEGVIKDMTAINLENANQTKANHDKGMKDLYGEWGAKFDTNMRFIQNLVQKTDAPPALVEAVEKGNVDPATAKWLHSVGEALGGEKAIIAQDKGGSGAMTPAEAKARVSEIMNNSKHPYWIASHPEHRQALDRMIELQRMANPDAATDLRKTG